MQKNILKAAMAAGFLAAGLLLWLAFVYRTVSREALVARIEERSAELAQGFDLEAVEDPARAERVALAISVGQRVLARSEEEPEGKIGGWTKSAMRGFRTQYLEGWGLHLVLVQLGMEQALSELSGEGAPESTSIDLGHRGEEAITVLCTALALHNSRGVVTATGGEKPLECTELMLRLGTDLLATREPEFVRLGTDAIILALTSPREGMFRNTSRSAPRERLTSLDSGIFRLVGSVSSRAKKDRLAAAIETAGSSLQSPRERIALEFQSSMERLLARADEEFPEQDSFPHSWLQDLEALIAWQDAVLQLIEDPGVPVTASLLAPTDTWRRTLHTRAEQAAGDGWRGVVKTLEFKSQLERVSRELRAEEPVK